MLGEAWRIHLQAYHVSQPIKHGGGAYLCVGLYDFPWHELHVQDRGEDDTNFVSYHSSRWDHEGK